MVSPPPVDETLPPRVMADPESVRVDAPSAVLPVIEIAWLAVMMLPPSVAPVPARAIDALPVPVRSPVVVIAPPRMVMGSRKVELAIATACVPPLRPTMRLPKLSVRAARSEAETSSVPAPPPMPCL